MWYWWIVVRNFITKAQWWHNWHMVMSMCPFSLIITWAKIRKLIVCDDFDRMPRRGRDKHPKNMFHHHWYAKVHSKKDCTCTTMTMNYRYPWGSTKWRPAIGRADSSSRFEDPLRLDLPFQTVNGDVSYELFKSMVAEVSCFLTAGWNKCFMTLPPTPYEEEIELQDMFESSQEIVVSTWVQTHLRTVYDLHPVPKITPKLEKIVGYWQIATITPRLIIRKGCYSREIVNPHHVKPLISQ